MAVITGILAAGLIVLVRELGGLQAPELWVYDTFVRARPVRPPDPRLLIVGITEADISAYEEWPITDQVLAELLAKLQAANPRVIGLDLYRDFPEPPGYDALHTQLQAGNVIGIYRVGDGKNVEPVAPPPTLSPAQIGFNDNSVDPGGTVRRQLLFLEPTHQQRSELGQPDASYLNSFALQIVTTYLRDFNIFPQPSSENPEDLQLGVARFPRLRRTDGGYQAIDDRGYQILLNYRSQYEVADQASLTQVLNGSVHPHRIRGKIVLIGTAAASVNDEFYTPYSLGQTDHQQMNGIEVMAQMISQLLDGALGEVLPFQFWPDQGEIVWTLLWALIGSGVVWIGRHPFKIIGLGGIAVAILWGTSYGLFLDQTWIPVVTPTLAFLAASTSMITYSAQTARHQRQMVMTLLGQNASSEIAAALWQERDRLIRSGRLPGQTLTATVLFTDLQNFTQHTENLTHKLTPEELIDWLNEYLSALTEVVHYHRGIVSKFLGDGIMAVFGVPIPRQHPAEIAEDAQRAVACAVAMQHLLNSLNHRWKRRKLPQVQMRIGISTGSVIVGSLGGKSRLEYGVIGDTVNVASRLEGHEKDRYVGSCRILISQQTRSYLGNRFQVKCLGPQSVKGKHDPIAIYQVIN